MRDRFQLDYLSLLDGRLASIEDNITTQHYEEARIAMLSLEAASGMLGAQHLVERLRELRAIVDVGPPARRTELMAAVRTEAADVRQRLENHGSVDGSDSVL